MSCDQENKKGIKKEIATWKARQRAPDWNSIPIRKLFIIFHHFFWTDIVDKLVMRQHGIWIEHKNHLSNCRYKKNADSCCKHEYKHMHSQSNEPIIRDELFSTHNFQWNSIPMKLNTMLTMFLAPNVNIKPPSFFSNLFVDSVCLTIRLQWMLIQISGKKNRSLCKRPSD